MLSLQFIATGALDRPLPLLPGGNSSSFWAKDWCLLKASPSIAGRKKLRFNGGTVRVLAMSGDSSAFKMNLNEYLVTLEKPLGIRFAVTANGKIIVHSLKKGGNGEKARIIMVGDTLKKAGDSSQNRLAEIKNVEDAQNILKEQTNPLSMVFERPRSPFPIHLLHKINDSEVQFNRSFPLEEYEEIKLFSDEEYDEGEWAHGSFPLEEYVKALDRSKGEMYYDHSLGMRYTKISEQIYVGSCIQTEADVETLSKVEGVTAVLNFQSATEAENWGIDFRSINESCQRNNILMISYSIRAGDSYDMRKKLPFCVGLLLRLLRKSHRVFVTCTSGFDRSPACVIAYLHWMTDLSLHAAYTWVTGMYTCRPDRPAIAWATWDLIAMVEKGNHDGPPTHAVTFVWNDNEGKDVTLVGDFTGNWKEPIKAMHKGGMRYEAEVKLPQGKYYYKFIADGNWRHSTASPAERDERGNVNNVIVIGDIASVRPSVQHQPKDANVVKVIERPLDENERFKLAKAARCIAFNVCPITLTPKSQVVA